jgi:hypothetical protein
MLQWRAASDIKAGVLPGLSWLGSALGIRLWLDTEWQGELVEVVMVWTQ